MQQEQAVHSLAGGQKISFNLICILIGKEDKIEWNMVTTGQQNQHAMLKAASFQHRSRILCESEL